MLANNSFSGRTVELVKKKDELGIYTQSLLV